MNALELQQIHIMSVSIVLHLTTLQMLGTPFSVAPQVAPVNMEYK